MSRILDAHERINLASGGKIADLNALVLLLTGGGAVAPEHIYAHKDGRVAGAAATTNNPGMAQSLWQFEGTPLSHGAVPGAFAIPDNTTVGGLMQADPGGGRSKLLRSFFATSPQSGTFILYDRLLHWGGLDGTSTGVQNANGGASADVTRYTNGVGNQLWCEIYTQIGATATTATVVYADGGGTSRTAPVFLIGSTNRREAQRMLPVPMLGGFNTVKGIVSVQLTASTLTAGDFGFTIMHPLAYACVASSSMTNMTMDFLTGPIAEILTDACLAVQWLPNGGNAPSVDMSLWTVEV